MYAYELCRKYQAAVNQKDLTAVLALFVPDAMVKVPLLGTMDVHRFHSLQFRKNQNCIVRLTNTFDSLSRGRSVALQFQHTCVRKDGTTHTLEVMNVFDIDTDLKRFKSMNVLFDPTALCGDMFSAESLYAAT